MKTASGSTHARRVIVSMRDVDVRTGGHTLLHRINWELAAGEHWGVVGGNGAGKTSFLRLVAGELSPPADSGARRYDFGFGVQRDAVAAQRYITLVGHELQDRYQRLGLDFTALEVVLSGVFRTDVPRREPKPPELARATELIERLGLTDLAPRPFLELSRGEQRRVLIARALGFAPQILILDEPAAGLDAATRNTLHAMIEELSHSTAVIYSAHEARNLPHPINRVAHLAAGRIVSQGPFTPSAAAPSGAAFEQRDRRARRDAAPVRDASAAPQTPPLISIEHGEVWIGERRVLTDLNWRLRAQEHWLIRGRNGSGKSTFLRLLHGQFRSATGGSIHWPALGDPRNIWVLRRKVAWVSPELQAAYLYPATVRGCVTSGFESSIGLMRRPTKDEATWVETLLERFELTALAERSLKTLSYGQMRRVLIVRALVNKPRVLLLDEPWEGLDTATLAMMHRYLVQIIAQGTQLVCASHVPRDFDCFTHELEIEDGRIVRTQRLSVRSLHADSPAERS
jgi:molybdate transport system ATP-binding protein